MRKPAIATFLLAVFASLHLAAASACEGPGDRESCCCAIATAPVASMAARLCCEERCGKTAPDVPSPPADASALALPRLAAVVPSAAADVTTAESVPVPVALKSAARSLLDRNPPEIYVRTATFLI